MDNGIAIVVTSIGDGGFLEGFCRQGDAEGIRDRLSFYVIRDRKTPAALVERCSELSKPGFPI